MGATVVSDIVTQESYWYWYLYYGVTACPVSSEASGCWQENGWSFWKSRSNEYCP